MRALVTGGFGFLGSHLTNFLVSQGWHVTVVDRDGAIPCIPLPDHNIKIISGPYHDPLILQTSLVDINVCFHLASSVGPANSNEKIRFDIESNLAASIALMDAIVERGGIRIVYLSSGGTVYGDGHSGLLHEDLRCHPSCSYGIVKLAVENYLRLYSKLHDLEYNVLRLANPYGIGQRLIGNQGVIANFIGKILTNVPIEIWGDGSVIRDYIHISDVSKAIVLAGISDAKNEIFNIASGEGLSLSQIVQILKTISPSDFAVTYKPSRKIDVAINILNVDKAKSLLNWTPSVTIDKGIAETFAWASGRSKIMMPNTQHRIQ